MNIHVSGINYKTTPLEIREKLNFSGEGRKQALEKLRALPGVSECVLISTCNRTEVYVYSENGDFTGESVEALLCGMKGMALYGLKKYFYAYSGVKAVRHLFKVSCGLDSQVLGEDQILGQVKEACELSLEAGTSAAVLNTLFREAVTAAKKVKTLTGLSKNPVSAGSLAVRLAAESFGMQLENRRALVIGTGKMGAIALKNLHSRGIGKIYVTSRTHGKAREVSMDLKNVQVVEYNDRYSVMDACDIIISSTASPHYTITRDMLEKALLEPKKRVFIDLAVPRDIDSGIKELEGVVYFNIDQLQSVADENIDKRLVEVPRAEEIIHGFVAEYEKWYDFREVLPVVREIQRFAGDMLDEKVSDTISRLKCASEEDKELVRVSIAGIVGELMNKFVYSVRECGRKEDVEAYFRCLSDVMQDNKLKT